MAGEVIRLEFKSPHVEEDMMAFLSCKHCRNKTFTLTLDQPPGSFPLMRCACCGQHIGRMAWAQTLNRPNEDATRPGFSSSSPASQPPSIFSISEERILPEEKQPTPKLTPVFLPPQPFLDTYGNQVMKDEEGNLYLLMNDGKYWKQRDA